MKIISYAVGFSCSATAAYAELPDPLTDADFPPTNMIEVQLGRFLFYDPILSGNRNISCATCHHPKFATGDGLSLGLGEGGIGLGPDRIADPQNLPEQLIPRNAPGLFNLGARQTTAMFADGRIEVDPSKPNGIRTPLDDEMVSGFASLLSAQTMFPVLSADEMAGHYQENDVSIAVRRGLITGKDGAWDIISKRVSALDEYSKLFNAAYPEIASGRDIDFTDISNAIATFISFEWRSDASMFDAVLRGEIEFQGMQAAGAKLFFGSAGCSVCHTGPLLSDMGYHPMGQPQIGPGKAARFENHQRDVGRMRVTGRLQDAFSFRTPSLRNVTRTGPWGHAGAFTDLRQFLEHHADPKAGLTSYQPDVLVPELPDAKDPWSIMNNVSEIENISTTVTQSVSLNDAEIDELISFLETLDDPVALAGRLGVPAMVPSGLQVDQ